MSSALNHQLLRLAELLQLSARAREARLDELPFVIVNETVRVIPYDQAVLWDARTERLVALSGAARVEAGAPYVLSLNRLYRRVVAAGQRDAPHGLDPVLAAEAKGGRDNWLAPYLLWWPLRLEGQTVAVLLLGRRDPWTTAEEPLLEALCGSYAQAWELARVRRAPVRPGRLRRLRRIGIPLLAVCLLAAGFIPVRSSAIAPAEVVARAPAFVRAPFAGVVDAIDVAPNAVVHAGQVLVRLDRRQLEAGLRVAAKAAEVATAQYRQATQEAITDPRARDQLVVLRGKLDEARADFEYRQTLLGRADIPSPADGIAVFNDPAEWIGRPVETGERIMQVSPPTSLRIEIELPVTETLTFDDRSEVLFFNNVNPDQPTGGRLVFMSYATTLSPSGVLVYTARADLDEASELRLGLKGTAKIFGRPRPIVLQLLRRPLAYLRELLA